MSFGKLLAAGKSIINGHRAAAYRADKRIYLPKFGSSKNPFVSPTQTELPKAPAENLAVAPAKKVVTPVWKKTQKMPVISTAPKSRTVWTSKLNPLSRWCGLSATQQSVQPVVQSELSLDSVKVVHNDLSDAEVEVVPIKSRPARATEPVLQTADGESSWSRAGAKFFGTNTI